MKETRWLKWLAVLAVLGFMLGVAPSVYAAGTLACTQVDNKALLSYSVGGLTQSTINSSPTGNIQSEAQGSTGTVTSFKVDNKVNLTVAEVGSAVTAVVPGGPGGGSYYVLTFTVTNNGNNTQDYSLASFAKGTGTTAAHGGFDAFDLTSVSVFVDGNGNGTYQSGSDTATFIDELAPDQSISVFIVSASAANVVPITRVNNDIASYHLKATTRNGGTASSQGSVTTEDTDGDDHTSCDEVVFADGAGSYSTAQDGDDAVQDGEHSDDDDFKVATSEISVQKTATTIWDPFNYNTNPLSIPGAYIRYSITISNGVSAGASASLTTIGDDLNNNLGLDFIFIEDFSTPATPASAGANSGAEEVKATYTGGGASPRSTGYFTADVADANNDGVTYTGDFGGDITINMTNASGVLPATAGAAVGELRAGESITLQFNVIVQ